MPKVRVLRAFRDGDTGQVLRRGQEVELPAQRAKFLASAGYVTPIQAKAGKGSTADDAEAKG